MNKGGYGDEDESQEEERIGSVEDLGAPAEKMVVEKAAHVVEEVHMMPDSSVKEIGGEKEEERPARKDKLFLDTVVEVVRDVQEEKGYNGNGGKYLGHADKNEMLHGETMNPPCAIGEAHVKVRASSLL